MEVVVVFEKCEAVRGGEVKQQLTVTVYCHFITMDITLRRRLLRPDLPSTLVLIQGLQRDQPYDVAKIKKLQTSFSQREVTY